MKKLLLVAVIAAFFGLNTYAQDNTGLAATPPMGWNSWNIFQTKIDEPLLKQMVDAYVSSGMRDAGYTYFVLDDGWMAMQRDRNGQLVADPKKFPNGMKAFADYVHSKGMKFGIYNCAGSMTCAGYPGTRGHEYEDARLYASWGVDYLKFDWCHTDSLNAREAYKTMSDALKATGRPIVFSLCEWGGHDPWLWNGIGQLYRTTGDINVSFVNPVKHPTWEAQSVLSILDKQEKIRQYNHPGHWNDPDMLEVGNGLTNTEDKSHFSLWCMMSAPLMAGNNLEKMSDETKNVLTNKDVIALDQDALGVQCFKVFSDNGVEAWAKPLANGDWAICFLNRTDQIQNIDYDWARHAINDDISKTNVDFTKANFKLRDLWTKKDGSTTKKSFKQTLASHDVIVLRLIKG